MLKKILANTNLEYGTELTHHLEFITNPIKLLEALGLKLSELIYIYSDFIIMFHYNVLSVIKYHFFDPLECML